MFIVCVDVYVTPNNFNYLTPKSLALPFTAFAEIIDLQGMLRGRE